MKDLDKLKHRREYEERLNVIKLDKNGDAAGTSFVNVNGDPNYNGYGNKNWIENIWPKINEYISNKNTVIDVGAGNGRRSKFFSNHVSQVTAIDVAKLIPGKEYDKVTNEISNVNFIDDDFLQHDFSDKKFDVAYCEGSFYYMSMVHGAETVFKKINSIVNENGYIIILEGKHNGLYDFRKLAKKYKFEYCIIDNEITWGSNPNSNALKIAGRKNDT